MSNNRRDFIKQAGFLTGASLLASAFPDIIQKAMAINPAKGSTFYDAEHIVFLMQENRSFDHLFGSLKGVRGFNDPRPYTLPNKDKVWVQRDDKGNAYAPFHIDFNRTKITWQGGLPHSWKDQIGARNQGKYDKWIPYKTPMCMAYYKREDVPFYYALADAFTICDHYFCSSLTGTTPNRLFFWSGNVRKHPNDNQQRAVVNNSQAESHTNTFVDWTTFPELLEDNGISWRVYQNELWTAKLKSETDDWCGNYGDNALEYVKRHQVKLSAYFRAHGNPGEKPPLSPQEVLAKYNSLSTKEKNLIDKAFTTNISQENYLELESHELVNEKGEKEKINLPKGDLFHQFRQDVNSGNLPTVSWLVAPQRFSDHTSSPLYGVWYVSEAMKILTENPEVWKKTIFIVNYDENDGYFDHIPPFVVPCYQDLSSGKVSEGIDTRSDFDTQDNSPIGLGYRVPMLVASPWSRGGFVNSQVFDHTSTLMFLEHFIEKKFNKSIRSEQISTWRRAICGDLTSVFRPYHGGRIKQPRPLQRNKVIGHIQTLKNKPRQARPSPLSELVIESLNSNISNEARNQHLQQEKGVKPACALPYDFYVDAELNPQRTSVVLSFSAADKSCGVPFIVQSLRDYQNESGKNWNIALKSGDSLTDKWELAAFQKEQYDLAVHGPNGFYRRFLGSKDEPNLRVTCSTRPSGKGIILILSLENLAEKNLQVLVEDEVYLQYKKTIELAGGSKEFLEFDLSKHHNWYNLNVQAIGYDNFARHYAGHMEDGESSYSDLLMGGMLGN